MEMILSTTLDFVTAEAMKLSPTERAELVQRLTDTLLPAPPLHPDWEAELAQRLADMDAGVAPSIPAEQILAQLRGIAAGAR